MMGLGEEPPMDSIIFGDNQFFGINHMSEEKAQAQAERFRDTRAILDVIDDAYECGLRGFMFNTHEQVKEICDHLREHRARYPDLRLYPSIPYAHKYANAVNEKGLVAALNDFLFADRSTMEVLGTLTRSATSIVQRDVLEIMKLLVDAEMRMFKGLNVQAIFLQNIVTDLVIGLGAKDVVSEFAKFVRKRFNVEPAFNTMNLPACVHFLLDAGIENPIVCASINKVGYLMSPSREACETAIRTRPFRAVAMSVLASGAIKPRDAVEYVIGLGKVGTIVFGASSRANIAQTVDLIRSARAQRDASEPVASLATSS
jgi:hypothetical protein